MKVYLLLLIIISTSAFSALETPVRDYSVILTEDGFYPDVLVAFKGERLNLHVTSTNGDKGCLFLREHNVFIPAEKGKIAYGSVDLLEAGKYEFYCPSVKHKGYLSVLENKAEPSRGIASERPQVDHWLPRDYD